MKIVELMACLPLRAARGNLTSVGVRCSHLTAWVEQTKCGPSVPSASSYLDLAFWSNDLMCGHTYPSKEHGEAEFCAAMETLFKGNSCYFRVRCFPLDNRLIDNRMVSPILWHFQIDVFSYYYRLEKFLKKEVNLKLSTHPDFEERAIDFSEVEQLMNSINTIPGILPIWSLF